MKRIVTYFIRFPIWVNVLMVSVMALGVLAFSMMRYSFFPEITPNMIIVQIPFPGASPEEVAEGVILKIEEVLDGLDGVDRTTSVSREHVGTVTIETIRGADLNEALADVKNAIDRISSFPADVEKPIIFEQKFRTRALSVVLFGQTDLYNMKYIAEELRDDLLSIDGISQVSIDGLPELELSIEVSEADLQRFNISFDEISSAVRGANVNISGGKFDTDEEEILIRAWGRDYFASELLDIPVRGNPDGTVVLLKDVAEVREQWEDIPSRRFYNDRTSLVLTIDQTESEDILAIADTTYVMVQHFNQTNDNVEAVTLDDRTIPLRQRIELLVRNGLIGLLLVVMALGFFLNLRLSFWVSIGIPFSFAGMFLVAAASGITINIMSLFGMILVVGILVDDTIVVGENIFAHWERGKPALNAAVDGTMEVIAPVSTSVLSTVIAFIPFFFLDGMLGKLIWHMALVVIASLIFSLIEAFFVLPSHLAHSRALSKEGNSSKLRKRLDGYIQWLTHRIYAPSLRIALKRPGIMLTVPAAMIFITVGLMGGGIIGFTFFPYLDSDRIPINVSLVAGSQEQATLQVLSRLEAASWEINEEIRSERADGKDVILGIKRDLGDNDLGESGSHSGRLILQLLDGEQRDMESQVIAARIRKKVGIVPEAQKLTYGAASHFGKAISISLLGNDYNQLDLARNLLVKELEEFSSLKDVTDSDVEGRRELNITLKPRAYSLGLTTSDVAGQVRQAFYGQEVQRIQRGRDEIRVWVRYRPEDRAALGFLDQMRIRTRTGDEYPFSEIAEYDIQRGITQINHLTRKREIKVEANMADAGLDLPPIIEEINVDVLPRVLAQVSGVTASFEGQSRDQTKMLTSIYNTFPIALFGMFILVILVFRSYLQSILIFSLIPIGALGGIWGHGILGLQVNMLSVIGIIALSGIIINDSIVLMDRVNRNLRAGMKVYDAAFDAGISRLRPILLTSLTTSLGLAPLILETSRQAKFLIPMAVSVAFGLVFGTFILLLVLPTAFVVSNNLRVWAYRVFKGEIVTPEAAEPAVREINIRTFE